MNPLLPLSKIFGSIVDVREYLYKNQILKSYEVPAPILSVGNLTFGGTGKTPICEFLMRNLKNKKKIALMSRGYGRKTKGFLNVNPDSLNAADLYGDEPTWLAAQHRDVDVFVCEDRVEGCRRFLENKKVDLIIADDAFQHLRLQRNFDVIVIDATEDLRSYQYPPLGRARNSFSYLKRSNAIFITKMNLARTEDLKKIREQLPKLPTFEFTSHLSGFYNLNDHQKLENGNQKVYLMSGIAKPWTFEDLTKENFNFQIAAHFTFADHFAYTPKTIQDLEAKIGETPLLVTQKDAIKLRPLLVETNSPLNVFESHLEIQPQTAMDSFYEAVN
jgi:tetraacyldisaccharide 4'-kinase